MNLIDGLRRTAAMGAAALAAACGGPTPKATTMTPSIPLRVPDKTVVLTFDDSVRSHLTVVAPILKERGLGATFFVTHAWMDDAPNYLDWEEIAQLDRMGFEIGNHSWSHVAFGKSEEAARLAEELARVERALAEVGVAQPVSFSWPGNWFGPEARAVLAEAGYTFARRGPQPDPPMGPILGMGALYAPSVNDPLLVPTSGLAVPDWTLEDFRQIAERARDGKIVVFQFHGVPDGRHPSCSTPPERFLQFADYLHDGGFSAIALRDVRRHLPAEPLPDPLIETRFVQP